MKENRKRRPDFLKLRFWGPVLLQTIGLYAGLAVFLEVIVGLQNPGFFWNSDVSLWNSICVYLMILPLYLMISGSLVMIVMLAGLYRLYFTVLMTMNQTRFRTAISFWLFAGAAEGVAFLPAVLSWGIGAGTGEAAAAGWQAAPLLCALGLCIAAFGTVIGVVQFRWGSVGTVLFVLLGMVLGGVSGYVGASGSKIASTMVGHLGNLVFPERFWGLPLLAGAAVYVLSGVFSVAVTRKAEARV